MDLTALELGLRNRQLLQVKCFLKIQVETFRYFLGEDLLRIVPEERVVLLEKFFHHDWQNVINKIVSVAVVNMSGDYSSMMLSISLFRSIIQSCNQLLLIVKALNESEFESLFTSDGNAQFLSSNTAPILYRSYSVDSSVQESSTTIKNRILNILQKQINSITSHLERIYSVNVGEIGAAAATAAATAFQIRNDCSIVYERSQSEINKKFVFLKDNKIDTKLFCSLLNDTQINNEQFTEIIAGLVPVLHLQNRDNVLEDVQETIIDSIVQAIVHCDITDCFARRIIQLLSQTGRSLVTILFNIFLTTPNCSLRQKILLILLIHLKSIDNIEQQFAKKDVTFSNCIQLCSIVDLFVYCFASNEHQLMVTLDCLLNGTDVSWSKCFIIPILEEITNTSESVHHSWRTLKQNFFADYWPTISDHYVQLNDFTTLLTPCTLWEYWIDNNEDDKLLKWIEHGTIDLIFCEQINATKDYQLCCRMVKYLEDNGSFNIKNIIYEQILLNTGFFSGYSLQELLPDSIDFQRILSIVGRTKRFTTKLQDSGESSFILDLFVSHDINVSLEELIVYCLQNRFYDYLYLLFEKYAHNSVLFQRVLVNDKLSEENQNILKLLIEMNPSFTVSSGQTKDILDQSILVLEYISKYDRSTNSESIIEILLDCSTEPELLLMILSLCESLNFEHLKRFLQESYHRYSNIFQRFPLISKIFYDSRSRDTVDDTLSDSLSIHSNVSRQRTKSSGSTQQLLQYYNQCQSSSDIYCLLQQAVPQVDIMAFFKSQIKKRKLIQKGVINPKDDSINNLVVLNFTQNHLSETYGLKTELTSSYYLKNGRIVEAFMKCMKNNKSYYNHETISDKIAVKCCRKAASIVYSSLADDRLVVSCIMFQNLVRYFCMKRKHSVRTRSSDVDKEIEKTRLHIRLGRMILQYCDDSTIQHDIVGDLKRSHFNNRKISSQKIVSFAVDSLQKKFSNYVGVGNVDDMMKFHKLLLPTNHDFNGSIAHQNHSDTVLLLEAFEWKTIYEFVEHYKLDKPMNFLRKCAINDNWLLFTIFAQLYTITKNNIQELLRENVYNNSCIAEHLMKAFQNSSSLTSADTRLQKMKNSVQTTRNDLYSKIFKEKLSPNISPTVDGLRAIDNQNDSMNASSSPDTFSLGSISIMSRTLDEKSCETLVLYEEQLMPDNVNKDFFQLILEIYQNCIYFGSRTSFSGYCFETTFRNTLLFASVSLSNPMFALLACSLHRSHQTPMIEIRGQAGSSSNSSGGGGPISPGSDSSLQHEKRRRQQRRSQRQHNTYELSLGDSNIRFNAFMCWLVSGANADIKAQLFPPNCGPEQYLKWSQSKCLLLIDLLSQNDPRIFSKLIQGFDVFNLEIPVLNKLLQFLVLFFDEKEYYQKDDVLLEYKRLLQDYNEDDALHSGLDYENMVDCSFENEAEHKASYKLFYTKHWIEKCSLILITNSLLLAKQFELAILLSHYNFARIQDSFSTMNHSIPDIQNLYFFSQCLVRLPDYNLPIRELLHDIQNVDYYQVFKSLIFRLQEECHFEEARNIINLLPKAKSNEFLINEWMLKAKQSNHFAESTFITDDDIYLDRVDLSFWENCWLQVTNLDPTMHSAYRVMERFAEHLESRKVHIKCFLYIKCLFAIETMLGSGEYDRTFSDTNDASQESVMFESCFDLIHEYYQMEVQLWRSLVDCEYLICRQLNAITQHKSITAGGGGGGDDDTVSVSADSLEENIELVWKSIWNDLTNFLRTSKLKSQIILELSKNHYFNNDLTNRNRKTLTLEDCKQDSLNSVIKKLLDSFCFEKAVEVAELFGLVHDDFEIIKACEDIAKDSIRDVMDLPISVQFLIQKMNKPKKEGMVFLPEYLTTEQKKAIMLIETVSELITIGHKSCLFVLLYYKIACVLQCTYVELQDKKLTHVQVFMMLVSSYGSETPRSFYDKTDLNSSFDSRRNYDREEFDHVSLGGDNGPKISATNQYNEAILCAKELIKLVGEQDDQLKDDIVIARHLADYTHTNIVTIIEEQFREFESFQNATGTKSEIEIDKSLIAFNNARFLILIKILKEPSILGHFLLDICKKLQYTGTDNNKMKNDPSNSIEPSMRKRLIVLSELFIRAHDCFTAQCDVQGISVLLRRIRVLIVQDLQPANYYQLILRLLTGIGRYSEMNYCFEIFHDKFEMILSKRVTRTPQLRIALLNYLKTTDKIDELLPLVAVRFFLFRETAEYHRARAEKMLIELNNQYEMIAGGNGQQQQQQQTHTPSSSGIHHSSSSLGKFSLSSGYKRVSSMSSLNDVYSHSPVTQSILSGINLHSIRSLCEQMNVIMNEYQEAQMNFTKSSSHNSADYCSRMAQLVALQIGILNHAKTQETISANNPALISANPIQFVLNLDSVQVRDFVNRSTNFYEALIVSRGYPDVKIDWSDPFFSSVIINSNQTYAQHYSQTFPISLSLLDGIMKRYEQAIITVRHSKNLLSVQRRNSITNSPSSSSASFTYLMSQIHGENELARMRSNIEQFLERLFLQQSHDSGKATLKIASEEFSLEDKHRILARIDSPVLLQKFTEIDVESNALIADLKRLKLL